MKKIIALCLVLFLVLPMLGACGLHEFKAGDPLLTLEIAKAAAKSECYKNRKQIDTTGMSEISKLALAYQQSNEKIIGAISGKPVDECADGTNLNDVLIADSRERNTTARSVSGNVTSLATTAVVTVGVVKALDKAFDSAGDKAGGDINKDHSSSTTGGDKVGRDKVGGDSSGGNKDIGGDQNGDTTNPEPPPADPEVPAEPPAVTP